MDSNFRSETFKLCKKLSKEPRAKSIANLIREMSFSRESDKGEIFPTKYGDLAQIARRKGKEFHSYIYLDDNADDLHLPPVFRVSHLNQDDRELIEAGHQTILRFIDRCIEGIPSEFSEIFNPYSACEKVLLKEHPVSLLTDDEIGEAASAFKRSSIYKSFATSNIASFFQQCSNEQIKVLFQLLDQSINQGLAGNLPADLQYLSQKLSTRTYTAEDIVSAHTVLAFSLRKSLRVASRMLYKSICGSDLLVFNNNNVINIDKRSSNILCNFFRILVQDTPINYSSEDIGDIVLFDCSPAEGAALHEFGYIVSVTLSFSQELGNTSKFSFVSVDEDLNPLNNLTKSICEARLSPVIIE